MGTKIVLGSLVLLGLLGMTFAHGGFGQFVETLPDDVKEQFRTALEEKDFETLRALREEYAPADGPLSQLTEEEREEIFSLKQQIHEAMESEDYETVKELRGEMRELLPEPPEGFGKGKGHKGGRGMGGPKGIGMMPPGGCPCIQAE